ncbi:MAG: dihydropteroate synthase [Legionella sp.]|jgi:dihydropteroate synthase
MNANQFLKWLDNYQSAIWKKPLIMGIINVTAESFSDGGAYLVLPKAIEQAIALIDAGADIIDIGGESTRPGAVPVSAELELARVIPLIEAIRAQSDVCISIDTSKPEVMQAGVAAGANLINDIFALQSTGALAMAATLNVPVCLMHMQGTPHTMQKNPHYPAGLIPEIMHFFAQRIDACMQAGIPKTHLVLDPGFGFGKSVAHNMQLMQQLTEFKEFALPLLLGVSRKSTIGAVLNKDVDQRLIGGIALAVYAALKGVGIIRTHDVDETNQALQMIDAVNKEGL